MLRLGQRWRVRNSQVLQPVEYQRKRRQMERREFTSLVYYRVAQIAELGLVQAKGPGIPAVHPRPKISTFHPPPPPTPSYPGVTEETLYETNLNLKKPYKFVSTIFCQKQYIYLLVARKFHRTFTLPFYTFLFFYLSCLLLFAGMI